MLKLLICLIIIVVQCSVCWAKIEDDGPIVDSKQGSLRGIYMETKLGRKFSGFLGIQFAKPPLNEMRFKPPVPGDSWTGIKNATEIHSICPQRDIYRRSEIFEGDEDCLYLNVYTPQLPSDGNDPLPVMVFFHGGGWLCGSGNSQWYAPHLLLDRDVLLVVTNYRIGALGFLSTGDEVVPGNNGLKDQSLALNWVQENIKNFGGNPDKVTIFGESAGGASVQLHMLSPLSKGLFTAAISQSGTAQCNWAVAPNDQGVRHAKKLGKALGCPTECTEELVNCLRKVDALEIVKKDTVFMDWDFDPMIPFKPVIEPKFEGAFLTEHPTDLVKAGKTAPVPWIVGLNTEDGALRAAGIYGNPHLLDEINEDFNRIMPISLLYEETAKNKVSITRKIRKFYFGDKVIDNSTREDMVHLYTDAWFLEGIDESIRLHLKNNKQPVYFYLFGHRGSSSFSEIFGHPGEDYGVCHADELQYLFPISDGLFPHQPPNEADKRTADIMTKLWANFANTGNPTPETNGLLTEKWDPVQSEHLMEYYYIDADNTKMKKGLFADRVNFWRTLQTHPKKTIIKDEL